MLTLSQLIWNEWCVLLNVGLCVWAFLHTSACLAVNHVEVHRGLISNSADRYNQIHYLFSLWISLWNKNGWTENKRILTLSKMICGQVKRKVILLEADYMYNLGANHTSVYAIQSLLFSITLACCLSIVELYSCCYRRAATTVTFWLLVY